jgi:hypothetical protein
MTETITVERWCPKCRKLFTSTRIVEREGGGDSVLVHESLCPDCGTQGEMLLQR